jgi:hypothetical protein
MTISPTHERLREYIKLLPKDETLEAFATIVLSKIEFLSEEQCAAILKELEETL